MEFEASTPSGVTVPLDGAKNDEGRTGPYPMEALLSAIAACSGMDVISILEKKRQKVTAYYIEIDGTRPPAGEFPRPFTTLTMTHHLEGEGIDPVAVERAIELSNTKYCSVMSTLEFGPPLTTKFVIGDPAPV